MKVSHATALIAGIVALMLSSGPSFAQSSEGSSFVLEGFVEATRACVRGPVSTQIEDCQGFESFTESCVDNVICIERSGANQCSVRCATSEERAALYALMGDMIDTLLAAGEVPGGGPQQTPPGLIDSDTFSSGETPSNLVRETSVGVTTPPPLD